MASFRRIVDSFKQVGFITIVVNVECRLETLLTRYLTSDRSLCSDKERFEPSVHAALVHMHQNEVLLDVSQHPDALGATVQADGELMETARELNRQVLWLQRLCGDEW